MTISKNQGEIIMLRNIFFVNSGLSSIPKHAMYGIKNDRTVRHIAGIAGKYTIIKMICATTIKADKIITILAALFAKFSYKIQFL